VLDGVRHFLASGQQYSVVSLDTLLLTELAAGDSPHGDSHAAPTFTQSFVSGQQVLAPGGAAGGPQSRSVLHFAGYAWRQCLASGQQYSSFVHTGGATQSAPGLTHSSVTGQQTGKLGSLHACTVEPGLHWVLDGVRHFLASGQQYSVVSAAKPALTRTEALISNRHVMC